MKVFIRFRHFLTIYMYLWLSFFPRMEILGKRGGIELTFGVAEAFVVSVCQIIWLSCSQLALVMGQTAFVWSVWPAWVVFAFQRLCMI